MQPKFTPIDVETDLDSLRFSVSTADIAHHDREIARFVELATAHKLPPSVFEVPGWVFPWLVPESLWHAPMWVHWLSSEYDDVIDELAHAQVSFDDHISTDLLKRRQVLCWNASTHSFCTSARGLQDGMNTSVKQEVLALFVSPTRFASNLARLTEVDVIQLQLMQDHSGVQYRPQDWHSRQEMSAALMASVLQGNEPKADPVGRSIVLLKKRAFPYNVR